MDKIPETPGLFEQMPSGLQDLLFLTELVPINEKSVDT